MDKGKFSDLVDQVGATAAKSWVTLDDHRIKKNFGASVKELSKQIKQHGIDGLNQDVSSALTDFFGKLNAFLKDVNRESEFLYIEMMDAIPEDD